VLAGLLAAATAVLLIAGLFLRSTHHLERASGHVARTLDVINEADHLLSLMKDAETGQRGFLLTGAEHYLAPYEDALRHLGPSLERLRTRLAEDASQRQRLDRMEALIQKKLAVMEHTLSLAREGRTSVAIEQVRSGEGKLLMDELRVLERELRTEEEQRLGEHYTRLGRATGTSDTIVLVGSGFLLSFIGFAAFSFLRDFRAREQAALEREALLAREQAAQVEAEAERQRARLQEILTQVPAMVGVYRAPDQVCELANPALRRLHGDRPLVGLTVREAHPEHADSGLFEVFDTVFRTGKPYTTTAHRLRPDCYLNFTYQPLLDARGQVEAVLLFAVEVTEQVRARQVVEAALADQRESEESLRFLSEASAALATSLDHEATLQQVVHLAVPVLADWCVLDLVAEDGCIERVAMAHANPTLGLWVERLRAFPPVENPAHPAARALHTGQTVHVPEMTPEYEERSAQSPEHLLVIREMKTRSLVSVPLLARGRTLGVLTCFITQDSGRRHDERDVLLAEELGRRAAMAIDNARLFSLAQGERQRAEEANRLKDDFLATVSHELRTPLTAMLGWMKMLRSGRLPVEKHAKALETVDRNAQAQAQLVEDLLDVSRIISGKLRLDTQPVELVDVIQAALESVRPAADAKDIQLHLELGTVGSRVMGDPGRLQQVVWNLVSNAVKFSPGGSRVRVLLERGDGAAEVTVVDEGPGIPADFLPHLFERFTQLEGGTTRRHGGLGLGLAIVRHLVELHGGTVRAASDGPGRGATFTVRLPLAAPRPSTGETPSPRRTASVPTVRPAHPPSLSARNILVVDDEQDNREVLKVLLEGCGANVVTASSVPEALRALREAPPDLLVSDIGMPGEDGYSLISQVRALSGEQGGRVPAVALTAYARVEDRTRALMAGFNMHVAKPVEPTELLAILSSLVTLAPPGA
jgi:signal transduction histidine kinase/CHASE3 domain sensor protein/ActR/RegA family two-component response regulator